MPKKARYKGFKSYRTYTLDEAATISGVSSRTIRNWARRGLCILDAERPHLVRGDDITEYIKSRRKSRKAPTAEDELYCFRCRAPRKAAGGFADCEIDGRGANLIALCSVCETVISQRISMLQIPAIGRRLDLTIKRDEGTL